jgi:uncharacterized protein YbjQ (UPF0145 family)
VKSKDIAKSNGLDSKTFDQWLKQSDYETKSSIMTGGLTVDDGVDTAEMVGKYNEYLAREEERLAQEQERLEVERRNAERAAQDKQRALASMLITSGFNFDGFTITKYSGYISGDAAVQVARPRDGWFGVKGNVGDDLMASLEHIRREALGELKEAAYALGCNAVIGVDFDYLTLDPETVTSSGGTLYLPFLFGVTANGNAVIIEKNDRTSLA